MGGIYEYAVMAAANLSCAKRNCTESWTSEVYEPTRWDSRVEACRPAFDAGWRVFVGKSTQHTYCPVHGPEVEMRQVHPKEAP